jgi:hypothetical protein
MARNVTLWSNADEKIKTWQNVLFDCTNSHTVIHDKHESFRFIDQFDYITMIDYKTVVYLKSGFYFVVCR